MFELLLDRNAVPLKKAVAPLTTMSSVAHISISPEEVILVAVSDTRTPIPPVGIALRMPSSGFTEFRTDDARYVKVNLHHLSAVLARTIADDRLTINGDEGDDIVGFNFFNHRTREIGYSELELLAVYPGRMEGGIKNHRYEVIVGIPSAEFRRIMIHLSYFGMQVEASITNTEVKLSAMNEEVILTNEECIIGGAVSENPVTAVFRLHYLRAILNASLLSSTVWLLYSSLGPPTISLCTLNFPVGALGNLLFDFPYKWDMREVVITANSPMFNL